MFASKKVKEQLSLKDQKIMDLQREVNGLISARRTYLEDMYQIAETIERDFNHDGEISEDLMNIVKQILAYKQAFGFRTTPETLLQNNKHWGSL